MPRTSTSAAAQAPGSEPVARAAALGWSGLVFVAVTVFLAIGAVNSQNNLLFWIFGIAVSGVVVSGLFSGSGLMGVLLHAHPVPSAEADRATQIRYTLTNTNRHMPVFAVVIREAALTAEQPDAPGVSVAHLPAGQSVAVELAWTPDKRGDRVFDRIVLESRFPFGLLSKTLEFTAPRRTLVRPARVELSQNIARSTRRADMGSTQRRAKRGGGGAFFGLREYSPGDPRRTVAWRPSARRGQLLVVEHAEPRRESVWVWITRPGAAVDPLQTERSIALACSVADASPGPVGVWMPWCGVRLRPGEGNLAKRRIADALAMTDPDNPTGPDGPPPIHAGDETIVIGPQSDVSEMPSLRLDPARPEQWLAPGAELPRSLSVQEPEVAEPDA